MSQKRSRKYPSKSSNHSSKSANVKGNPLGEVRIIGGDLRGRKLPVLNAEGLRPTSDRVRETLFNWLQFEIPGANCLDVFSGSGALSFEALSRGAKHATLLELDSANAKQLKQNLQQLKLDNAQVEQVDSLQWLAQPANSHYDVVFLDPPFHKNFMQNSVDLLFKNGYVNNQAWLYLEQEKQLDWPVLPDGWECHREKSTSQVRFGLFKYKE
ncbi:16S rRNA (guanine(966)-N(2))-methyltransferase RsmD [Thiomicrorhabdus immobilis]|uniref:16S rRNA (guanine(966)-N(2))-methyltransferase RsmD n=1 Tax=Thiomicrorhabdus immobilis TaxID=2791037 RepID=UPI001F01DA4E|nr:16S rRNA (guanine(966)-N(2))-methyltransferase RsmD [Thiomicrorhabdus immobilis]